MGEKHSDSGDYYMETGNYPEMLEFYRHGFRHGSNYLYMDWHVATKMPWPAHPTAIDPWDLPNQP
jgi:prepilin-type processing-associated H-X9-DG protein